MKIGTASASNTTEIQIPYVPEILHYRAQTNFDRINIDVAGDGVITKLNQSGLNAVGKFESQGSVDKLSKIRLSDGLIKNKNTTITIVNGQASDIDIFGFSTGQGELYTQTVEQQVFADSGQLISDFNTVAFPNAGANDLFVVTFSNGLTQRLTRDELQVVLSYQRITFNSANDYVVNNANGVIKAIDFNPVQTQIYYLQRFAPAKGAITSEV